MAHETRKGRSWKDDLSLLILGASRNALPQKGLLELSCAGKERSRGGRMGMSMV